MLESYIRTGDGKDYVDVDCVREALGIKEDENIFRAIEKLREERDGLKAELELTNRLYKENRDFVDKVCEAVDIQRPYLESGYANAVRLITGFKRERDELKEKCDKLKLRANALYGTSCGYSASKEPAFRCNVISYGWEFSPIVVQSLMDKPFYRLNNDSIRVELELTPNANYKGTIDMEDLKRYIEAYGREKKLSDFEIFCKLVNNCIDELCDKYVVVKPDDSQTTRERLDYIFAVLAENRERYNSEGKRVEELIKEKRAVENALAELRAKVREIYRSVVDDEWDEYRGYTSALNAINEEYKRVVHKLKDDGCNAEKEFLDAVKKRIGVSADCSDNAYMLRLLDIKLDHSALSTFTDNVYKELGLPRYGYTLTETIYNLKNRLDCDARLRSNICTALGLGGETSKNSNSDIINRVIEIRESHEKLCKDCLEDPQRDLSELRKNAIEELKSRGFLFRPEEDETLTEIYAKLLKRYDWTYGSYKEQHRLRQMWHLRWESENERANGEHKRAEKLRKEVTALANHIELLKLSNASQANSVVASQAFKNECRKLRDEKTKVISALGQDIWDDCLK